MGSKPLIKYVFTLFGLVFLLVSYYMANNTQKFLQDAQTSSGTVIDLVRSKTGDSQTYRPVVEFKASNGARIEFISSSGSNPPSYTKGEVVDVLYQEAFPEKARINGFFSLWGGSLILGGMGSVIFMVGFSIIVMTRLKSKKTVYLQERGVRVSAKFQGVELNSRLNVQGKNPYQIVAQWHDPLTSKLYIYKSDNIWFDPTDFVQGKDIVVLIEKGNPQKYHVDLSFLPEVVD